MTNNTDKSFSLYCILPGIFAKAALVIFLFMAGNLHAAPVSAGDAEEYALSWFHGSGIPAGAVLSRYTPKPDAKPEIDLDGAFHVINIHPAGFAIISADDIAYPVLAYSPYGTYSGTNMPPQFVEMLRIAVKEIEAAVSEGLEPTSETAAAWKQLRNAGGSLMLRQDLSRAILPLLTTSWDQGAYYNAHCPKDPAGPDGHVLAGCVATAMGQIMKFHAHPLRGTGSHSYHHSVYGVLSADFGATQYDWSAMPDSLSNYNDEVARLLFHCGVSVEMLYHPDGSGAYSTDARNALVNHFGYDRRATLVYRSDYSTSEWLELLKNDLHKGRPIYYQGVGSLGGHAFITDGYQGTDHFHFNWGWSGRYDTYYYLNDLTPGSFDFNQSQGAIVAIRPSTAAVSVPNDYTGDGVSDLAVYSQADGRWRIRSMEGDIIEQNVQWGYSTTFPLSGDYTGDGISDLAVYDRSGTWFIATIHNKLVAWNLQWGFLESEAVPGDYTGDWVSDLAVYYEESGAWFIISLAGEIAAYNEIWGGPGCRPVPGDYTGDGISDLAVYHEESGAWFIISLAGEIAAYNEIWGGPGCRPVPGDYTGDGISDLAVYHQETGQWFISSLSGDLVLWVEQWGGPGMIPVPGDYNGDERSDLAVFCLDSGLWFIATPDGNVLAWELEWGNPGEWPVGAIE